MGCSLNILAANRMIALWGPAQRLCADPAAPLSTGGQLEPTALQPFVASQHTAWCSKLWRTER